MAAMLVLPNAWWRVLIRVVVSVLCGGVGYFLWVAVFLLSRDYAGSVVRALLWVTAPVATAMGFAMGIVIHERLTHVMNTHFWRVLLWPLFGCAVGAVAVYWYGPMLIVFGMLALGTASVVLREVVPRTKHERTREDA